MRLRDTMDKIYRFRSIDKVLSTEQLDIKDGKGNLLKGYEELEKQQIYFSPLCQLNDPMEGSKDIYWQGDEIVWRNFLIHYLICLEHVFTTYLIGGDDISLSAVDIPVFKKKSDFPTEQYSNLFSQICSKFFSNNKIKQYPNWLAARDKNPIRRNELLLYIDSIHLFALKCISNALYENNLMATDIALTEDSVTKTVLNEEFFDAQKKLQEEHPEKYNAYEKLCSARSHLQSQLKFITHYNEPEINPNKKFLFSYFPELYLQEMEKLLYPNAYIACFSNSYQNASMWSHYAGSHEGICLQFKTENKGFLKLNAITGIGGSKTNTRDIRSTINLPIHKVNYQKEFHLVDFFRSIGVLPIPMFMRCGLWMKVKI